MNHQFPASEHIQNTFREANTEKLVEQLTVLIEWKDKARVQLEYFRLACTLYNLCDTKTVNELLQN